MFRARTLLIGFLACLVGSLSLALPVLGQALDPTQKPIYGIATLNNTPQLSPYTLRVATSSSIDASGLNSSGAVLPGQTCGGFTDAAPTFRLSWSGGGSLLRVYLILLGSYGGSGVDAPVLIIHDPAGMWSCSSNALIDYPASTNGIYDIWVGNATQNQGIYGALNITPFAQSTPTTPYGVSPFPLASAELGDASNAAGLSPYDVPTTAALDLAPGFTPDPLAFTFAVNGATDATPVGSGCGGFVNGTADVRIHQTGNGAGYLRFFFVPAQPAYSDTTMIVRAPGNLYMCSDDFSGKTLNPLIDIPAPVDGYYHIWIGGKQPGANIVGTLYITQYDLGELAVQEGIYTLPYNPALVGTVNLNPNIVVQDVTLNPAVIQAVADSLGTPPVNGLLGLDNSGTSFLNIGTLDPYFQPDPKGVQGVPGGGGVDIGALNPNTGCAGFYNAIPGLIFNLQLPLPFLRFIYVPDLNGGSDTTMIVRSADLQYYCNDDAGGALNPTVDVVGNGTSGGMAIWLGTKSSGAPTSGTIYITQNKDINIQNILAYAQSANQGGNNIVVPNVQVEIVPTIDPSVLQQIEIQPPVVTLQPFDGIVENLNVLPTPTPVLSRGGGGSELPLPPGLGHKASALRGEVIFDEGLNGDSLIYGDVVAGGSVSLAAPGMPGECQGFTSIEPVLRITYNGSGTNLRVYFVPNDPSADTTLAIIDVTNQVWGCSDDSYGTFHPTVNFSAPQGHLYTIWVGAFSGTVSGTLYMVTNDTNPTSPSS